MTTSDPYKIEGPALISFSGGRSSGYMLKHIIDAHNGTLPDNIKVAFSNTGKEMPETLDFVQECSNRWNVPIIWLEYDPTTEFKTKIVNHNNASRNGEPFAALIQKRKMLPNPVMRFCTIELKIKRTCSYCQDTLGWQSWANIIGFRADEMQRVNRMGKIKSLWTEYAPMAQVGVTKRDVQAWWNTQEFDLALPSVNGSTPMGNCDLCFLKGETTIRGIMRENPELSEWWIHQEMNAPGKGKVRRPEIATFRADRPSYAEMAKNVRDQFDWLSDDTYEQDRDCNCTD